MRIKTFKALKEYLYTDNIKHLDIVTSGELLVIANRDDLEKAKSICEENLISFIERESVVETLLDSLLHRASNLQQVCEWMIAQLDWFPICIKHSQWNELDEEIRKRIELDYSKREKITFDRKELEEELEKVNSEIQSLKEKYHL